MFFFELDEGVSVQELTARKGEKDEKYIWSMAVFFAKSAQETQVRRHQKTHTYPAAVCAYKQYLLCSQEYAE